MQRAGRSEDVGDELFVCGTGSQEECPCQAELVFTCTNYWTMLENCRQYATAIFISLIFLSFFSLSQIYIFINLFVVYFDYRSHMHAPTGLCHDCSYKVNYHHKRKEVTRKSKKRKQAEDSSRKDSKKKVKNDEPTTGGKEESPATSEAQKTEESSLDDIWKGPAKLPDEKSREEEFEEYLEDLFL